MAISGASRHEHHCQQKLKGASNVVMLGFMFSIFGSNLGVVSAHYSLLVTCIKRLTYLTPSSWDPSSASFITDYLVVRNGNARVAALFDPTSVYWYRGGVSWRATVAYVVAVMLPILGFSAEFGCSVSAGAVYPYEIGWLLTCVVNSVVQWALCRLGSAFAMEERQLPFEALAAEQLEAMEDEPAQDEERLQVSGEVKGVSDCRWMS
ncbi:hypothetical protein IWX49DRAFT_98482 [Phyllosticta citricarpa]|uniref:Uncharacterized protein n=1 Tax=Phyllosticta citricarpa TaxID=55181 RepID=A0ABR1MNG6_9PEZI